MQEIDHTRNIIEIRDVSFSYGNTPVLSNVSLTVHRGDYLALVGGNGSGKTTLLKIILGLLSPSTGTVRLFDKTRTELKDRSKIGYVPQKATNFDGSFPASVFEVALMGRYGRRGLFRRVTSEDREKTEDALRSVGIWDLRDRLIGDLSGGQQQRAFIARALAGEPEILVLDEPTVGVEKNVRDEFYDLLRILNVQLGLTVLLVTHDIESVAHQAMHVACIDGTLYYHTSVSEYLNSTRSVLHHHNSQPL